jgi:hypothetical protein
MTVPTWGPRVRVSPGCTAVVELDGIEGDRRWIEVSAEPASGLTVTLWTDAEVAGWAEYPRPAVTP